MGSFRATKLQKAVDFRSRPWLHILTNINRQVVLSIILIRSPLSFWKHTLNFLPQTKKAILHKLFLGPHGNIDPTTYPLIHIKNEGPVLAYHCIHWPKTSDMITPSCGTPG